MFVLSQLIRTKSSAAVRVGEHLEALALLEQIRGSGGDR